MTSTRSTPSGGRSSTRTTRRARRWPKRGSTARGVPLYASAESLGQAFNFDLLEADFDAEQFRRIVTANLELAASSGSSTTWVLSNHDVVRHATRYGLPHPSTRRRRAARAKARQRVAAVGGQAARTRPCRRTSARAGRHTLRARAAGLGLPVPGRGAGPARSRRNRRCLHGRTRPSSAAPGWTSGRDGCRVPLPWTRSGSSFGFGDDGAHLPQPAWFGAVSVQAQDGDHDVDADAVSPGAGAAPRAAVGRAAHVDRHRAAGRAAASSARTAGRSSPTSAQSPTNSIEPMR